MLLGHFATSEQASKPQSRILPLVPWWEARGHLSAGACWNTPNCGQWASSATSQGCEKSLCTYWIQVCLLTDSPWVLCTLKFVTLPPTFPSSLCYTFCFTLPKLLSLSRDSPLDPQLKLLSLLRKRVSFIGSGDSKLSVSESPGELSQYWPLGPPLEPRIQLAKEMWALVFWKSLITPCVLPLRRNSQTINYILLYALSILLLIP